MKREHRSLAVTFCVLSDVEKITLLLKKRKKWGLVVKKILILALRSDERCHFIQIPTSISNAVIENKIFYQSCQT